MRTPEQKEKIAEKIYDHYQVTEAGKRRWEEAHEMFQAQEDADPCDAADHVIDGIELVYGPPAFSDEDWYGSGKVGDMSIKDHIYESIVAGLT